MKDSIQQTSGLQYAPTRGCGLHCPHVQVTVIMAKLSRILICFIADCGVPIPPILGNYSHTLAEATLQFRCDEGFYLPEARTSVCTHQGMWTPPPNKHKCIGISCMRRTVVIERKLKSNPVNCGVPDSPLQLSE